MMPPDYAAIGVAAIGATIGALLAMAKFPEESRSATYAKGACSWLFSIGFSPAIFQGLVAEQYLPPRAEAMVALSVTLSFSAWVTLEIVHGIWLRYVRRRLESALNLPPRSPPKRCATDAKFAKGEKDRD